MWINDLGPSNWAPLGMQQVNELMGRPIRASNNSWFHGKKIKTDSSWNDFKIEPGMQNDFLGTSKEN